jgi:uncharacterized membrane protein
MSSCPPLTEALPRLAALLYTTLLLSATALLSPTAGAARADSAGCVADRYTLVELPLRPSAINASGEVAGTSEAHQAARWSRQHGLQEVPRLEGFVNSEGIAISARGELLVVAYDRTFSQHQSFTIAGRVATKLPGEQTRGYGINDEGTAGGEAVMPGKPTSEPVMWSKRTLRELDSCCGGGVKAVNNRGESIGDVYDAQGRYHAVLWSTAGIQRPLMAPDVYSSAVALNQRGHVLIQGFPGMFLYADGAAARLTVAVKSPVQPRAMNDCDVIVGAFGAYSDKNKAFLWEKTAGLVDLNSRIAPGMRWKLKAATAINDRGEIVGFGEHAGDDDAGFLLIPDAAKGGAAGKDDAGEGDAAGKGAGDP